MSNIFFRSIGYSLTLLTFLPSCASIVSDNDSTTYIATEPEGARCELHGQDFTRVVTAPDSINLPAEAAPITVACKADGFRTTTQELDTSMDGWVVGNLIFGGIIGVAIDAARGAGMKYPSQITVLLDPESFKTTVERDDWYDKRQKVLEEKWGATITEIENQCEVNATEACDSRIKAAQELKAKELEEVEQRRASAVVG